MVTVKYRKAPVISPHVAGWAVKATTMVIAIAAAVALLPACKPTVRFDAAAIASHVPFADVPRGFLVGVASSAYQTEGGNDNDWSLWERGRYPDGKPHVRDNATAARAADSWNLWREDVRAVQELGANIYRLGVEWSRLEPTEGAWNEGAAERYREILLALRRPPPGTGRAVAPMLNLYHFTLPHWLAARGGWEWPGAPAAFAAFAGRVAAAFGDLVDLWCTINEPNVYAVKSYLSAEWPPGVADGKRTARVLAQLLRGHGLAAAAIRRADTVDADGDGFATRIGLAHNVRIFDAASAHPADAIVANVADHFYNHATTDSVATGRVQVRLPMVADIDEPAPELRGSFDWLGLNYYTRDIVQSRLGRARSGGRPYDVLIDPETPRSDMGWPIYPEGLYRLLKRFSAYGWPIIVTENGIADRGGAVRPGFIRAHAYAVDRARADGVNVIGYLYWSLTDNFEWSHGTFGRFGLYTIDFDGDPKLARRPTAAVATFQELARNAGIR